MDVDQNNGNVDDMVDSVGFLRSFGLQLYVVACSDDSEIRTRNRLQGLEDIPQYYRAISDIMVKPGTFKVLLNELLEDTIKNKSDYNYSTSTSSESKEEGKWGAYSRRRELDIEYSQMHRKLELDRKKQELKHQDDHHKLEIKRKEVELKRQEVEIKREERALENESKEFEQKLKHSDSFFQFVLKVSMISLKVVMVVLLLSLICHCYF